MKNTIIVGLCIVLGIWVVLLWRLLQKNEDLKTEVFKARYECRETYNKDLQAIRQSYIEQLEKRKQERCFIQYKRGFHNGYTYAWVLTDRGEELLRFLPTSKIIPRSHEEDMEFSPWHMKDLVKELEGE